MGSLKCAELWCGKKHGVTFKVRVRGDVRHYICRILYRGLMTGGSTVVGSRVPANCREMIHMEAIIEAPTNQLTEVIMLANLFAVKPPFHVHSCS